MAYRNSAGQWVYDEKELDQQIKMATQRGEASLRLEPRGESVRFDATSDCFTIQLTNGVTLTIPRRLIEGVADATPEDAAAVTLDELGEALHWQKLDQDISVVGLASNIFGTRRWMAQLSAQFGQRGGQVKSAAKTASARANGAQGGRPRKQSEKAGAIGGS